MTQNFEDVLTDWQRKALKDEIKHERSSEDGARREAASDREQMWKITIRLSVRRAVGSAQKEGQGTDEARMGVCHNTHIQGGMNGGCSLPQQRQTGTGGYRKRFAGESASGDRMKWSSVKKQTGRNSASCCCSLVIRHINSEVSFNVWSHFLLSFWNFSFKNYWTVSSSCRFSI